MSFFQQMLSEILKFGEVHRLDSQNVLHLFITRIEAWQPHQENLQHFLHASEQAKIAQCRLSEVALQKCVARSLLRLILAAYTGGIPQKLQFTKNVYGKPYLQDLQTENFSTPLHFNVSHSKQFLLIGLCQGMEFGVDIEGLRPMDFFPLALRFFHGNEVKNLQKISAASQLTSFFRLWTSKEAVIKAAGVSISHYLDQFFIDKFSEDGVAHTEFECVTYEIKTFHFLPHSQVAVAYRQVTPSLRIKIWELLPSRSGCLAEILQHADDT